MPNTDADDNVVNSRSIVAESSINHWSGAGQALSSRYVRGTVELGEPGETSMPTVGRIESCSFSEGAESEELDDGACGVEAYDFFKLHWKSKVTARFRAGDAMPRIGTTYTLKAPEGGEGMAPLRFVVDGEPTVNWSAKGIRSISFSGKMHNSMLRSTLVTARLRADNSTTTQTSSTFPTGGFGDAEPAEAVAATGLLTSTGVNITDGDTITIGATVYRGKDAPAQAYDFRRGATAADSLANLKMAINATGVAGANYFTGTLVHPTVTAGALTATTLALAANTPGTAGNAIATTETAVTLSFGAVTLTGGTN